MHSTRAFLTAAFACAMAACSGSQDTHLVDGSTSDAPHDVLSDAPAPDVMADTIATPADVSDAFTPPDAPAMPPIGPDGGTVDRFRFAVFGDVRPPLPDEVSAYPTMIITQVMDGIAAEGAQFAIGTGDYMNENFCASCATQQIQLLQMAETHYGGHIFHAMGNHECLTISSVNCPNQNESVALRTYHSTLIPEYTNVWFDWTIHTSSGDAHFIATAPNAWSTAQSTWLTTALQQPARYTFVIAHEPPDNAGPGTSEIETAITARTGGVTLRLYGHVHEYAHPLPNAIITGNAGAPLQNYTTYGFAVVDQRADGNVVVTSYNVGTPPSVMETFVLAPDGTLSH
jgi:hypothetical protein